MLESTTFRNQEGYLTKFRNQTVAHSATKRVAIPQHSATKGGHPSLLEEGGVGADDGEEGAQRQQEEAHLPYIGAEWCSGWKWGMGWVGWGGGSRRKPTCHIWAG